MAVWLRSSYEAYAEVMGSILEVAGISGFLGTQDRGDEEAEQELGAWAELCEIWWQACRDKEVKTDYLFNLASGHKLLQGLWGGRDEHAARTAFGKAMANMRDRVIGRLRIRRTGTDSRTKALMYRLELIGEDQSAGVAGVRGGHSDGEKLNSGALEEIGQSPPSATRPDSKNNNLPVPMTPATPRTHYNPSGGCRLAGAVVEGAGEDAARMLLRLIRLL